MKFDFLPDGVKTGIDAELLEQQPLVIARSNKGVNDTIGESFLVAYDKKMLIFNKGMGKSDYQKMIGDYNNDIKAMGIRKVHNNVIFEFTIKNQQFFLTFGALKELDLNIIFQKWQDRPLTPYEILIISLMYLATADNIVTQEQDQYILKLVNNNQELLNSAFKYYEKHAIEDLLNEAGKLSEDQQLCLMANMIELAMCDGVMHGVELKLMKQFANSMGIATEEFDTIKQVLLVKNNVGVMDS